MSKAPETSWFRFAGAAAAIVIGSGPATTTLAAVVSSVTGPDLAEAARQNQSGLTALSFIAFRGPQTGWEIYAPLVAHEIGAASGPDTPAFAGALRTWQSAHGLRPTGVMDEATFGAMNALWIGRRPFVAASRHLCPPSPPPTDLTTIPASLSYGGKTMRLRPAALVAYQRMVTAAWADPAGAKIDRRLFTLFSAFRGQDADAARCASQGDCGGVTRAICSAHSTGLAVDIFLGAAPGFPPDSSNALNRLAMSQGPAYRWLVGNAGRFGFVPYAYEPWHWEWTGEAVTPDSERTAAVTSPTPSPPHGRRPVSGSPTPRPRAR